MSRNGAPRRRRVARRTAMCVFCASDANDAARRGGDRSSAGRWSDAERCVTHSELLRVINTPADRVTEPDTDSGYMSRKIESFERINLIRETNGNFDSSNSCKRLGTSCLHELHESKFLLVTRIEFIVRNFGIFLLMYPGSLSLTVSPDGVDPPRGRVESAVGRWDRDRWSISAPASDTACEHRLVWSLAQAMCY